MTENRRGQLAAEDSAWLDRFAREHGRPLRVLHVGNIANNAYLNAKFLRRAGVDCHVMSYDYYDVMATPEWEGDAPRPLWFAQGPARMCAEYLEALVEGDVVRAQLRKRQLALARWLLAPVALRPSQSGFRRFVLGGYFEARRTASRLRIRSLWLISWLWNWWQRNAGLRIRSVVRRAGGVGSASAIDSNAGGPQPVDGAEARLGRSAELVSEFDRLFPDREDRLTTAEALDWFWRVGDWERLFARYDIVQCYATDPIRALVTAKHPYVAFEHGTLRDFTMGDDPLHRLNALAYRSADHVLITNGDCLAYAERLGIDRYTPMVHPVDVEQHATARVGRAAEIRRRLGADTLLLCPLRHDWAIKGTDVHLRALPELVKQHGPGTVLALCEWGAEIDRSVELIESSGAR